MLGHVNLLIHEIQKAEGIHLSNEAREHIDRLMCEAIMDYSRTLHENKEYWRNKYMEVEYR